MSVSENKLTAKIVANWDGNSECFTENLLSFFFSQFCQEFGSITVNYCEKPEKI